MNQACVGGAGTAAGSPSDAALLGTPDRRPSGAPEGNSRALSTWRLPETLEQELAKFEARTRLFASGRMSAAEYRAFRVPQGVYEQREEGRYMIRCRFPAGAVLPHHLRALAEVSRRHGDGILHVTSRQDIQVHCVQLEGLVPALKELYAAGISARGGGGNTVRNVTACADCGVCPHELFDVTPHATALTEFLLRDPLSFQLPRKFKVAFAGCDRDCPGTAVNDLGFVAKQVGGRQGFAVYAGGGMGACSQVGELLEEFVTPDEVFLVAEALKRVFDRHGDRKNKQRARLRFLVQRMGFEQFRGLYREELAALRASPPGLPRIGEPAAPPSPRPPAAIPPQKGFAQWRQASVRAQKQEGYSIVDLPLPLGDLPTAHVIGLADIVEVHGEGMLRSTQSQNLCLRWVREAELPALHAKLAGLGLARALPPVLRDMTVCAGAATCKLGICLSRGLAQAVANELQSSELNLAGLGEVRLSISGCPDACGRHPVAQVGLYGAARRVGARLAPYYILQLGGRVGEGRTRLADGHTGVPARNVPAFLKDLFAAFLDSGDGAGFDAFLDAGGRERAEELARGHREVPGFEQDPRYYVDWSADGWFSLAGRGPGECGAGVFDLIEVDLASAAAALAEGRCFAATVHAARALLVTRGVEPCDSLESLELFRKLFLAEGLLEARFAHLLEEAIRCASLGESDAEFRAQPEEAGALLAAVKTLYEGMDSSLRFTPASGAGPQAEPAPCCGETAAPGVTAIAAAQPCPDRAQDFRGVACPLNYVKTKLTLEQMQPGQTLAVLLDEQGSRNVPGSVSNDGHAVLSVEPEDGHWRVVIRKAGKL